MPSVLSYTNAFPGIPVPQHKSGASIPRSYLFQGALQPIMTGSTTVLFPPSAFPALAFPQHKSGQSSVTSYIYPGAVQPFIAPPAVFILMPQIIL